MFQDGSDRLPTDSPPAPGRRRPTDDAVRPRLTGTDDSPRKSNGRTDRRSRRRPRHSYSSPSVRRRVNAARSYNTDPRVIGYLLRGLMTADEPVVALRPPKMHTLPRAERTRRTPCGCGRRARRGLGELNPTNGLCGPLRLPLNGFTYC